MAKFEFIECTTSWKFEENLCTVDVQKVWIHGKIRICWIYDIVKIQWKIENTRWIENPDLRNNSNSWNVQYSENSMEICVD